VAASALALVIGDAIPLEMSVIDAQEEPCWANKQAWHPHFERLGHCPSGGKELRELLGLRGSICLKLREF
jgi:hypothetical protein